MKYKVRYILAIIEFQYDIPKSRSVPNEIRQAFLGISPPLHPYGRGSPNIPKKLRDLCKYDEEIITPIHFSLIKKPTRIEIPGSNKVQLKNPAVGAMILYEYLGKLEDLKTVLNIFDEYIRTLINKGKPKYFSSITNHDFITGRVWDDPSET